MKNFGWRFDKKNSMTTYLHKTTEMNCSRCIKIPLRSSVILIIEKNDNYCFIWSMLASLHPSDNTQPIRVPKNRPYSVELNIDGFDVSNRFR